MGLVDMYYVWEKVFFQKAYFFEIIPEPPITENSPQDQISRDLGAGSRKILDRIQSRFGL